MKLALGLLFAMLLSLGPASASATTVVAMGLDELVKASDLVVVGQIVSVAAFEEKGRVYTHVDVSVVETLRGASRPTLRIVHIGGRTEKLATHVAGMPAFVKGERAVLFLEQPKGYEHFVVTGLAQGKIDLQETDGQWHVKRRIDNLHAVKPFTLPSGDVQLRRAPLKPIPVQSLSELRKKIVEHTRLMETVEQPAQ